MVTDIKPMYIKGLACYEGSMVVVAAHRKREYELAYSNTFGISYLENEGELIGDRFITTNEFFDKQITKYCGIEMVPVESKTNLIETVDKLLENDIPVGVETDAYYCPWSFEYKKNNFGHHFMIIDKGLDGYKCIDTTMYEKYYFIDYDDFILGTKQIVKFNDLESHEEYNYLDILMKSIALYKQNNTIKHLNNFYRDFSCVNYDKEFASFNDNRWGCALQKNIGFYIMGSVELYLEFLMYISSKIEIKHLPAIINSINETKTQWNALYNILLKIFYTKNETKYKEKSLDILRNIIDKYNITFDFFEKIEMRLN